MHDMIGPLLTPDDPTRARLVGWLAALLFFGSGVLLLINVPLPGPADVNRPAGR